jgi:hypothetical protein
MPKGYVPQPQGVKRATSLHVLQGV